MLRYLSPFKLAISSLALPCEGSADFLGEVSRIFQKGHGYFLGMVSRIFQGGQGGFPGRRVGFPGSPKGFSKEATGSGIFWGPNFVQ